MQIFVLILSFFIFLYTFFRLVKDDHVFLRKNIKTEEIFDMIFIACGAGLIFTQIIPIKNISFITLFIPILWLNLLLIGKYKKVPLGRFFDYFTTSFVVALPFIYLMQVFLTKKTELIINLIYVFSYLLLAIIFNKILLKKMISRIIKEGDLSIYFIIFYSILSLSTGILQVLIERGNLLNFENIIFLCTFILGLILLLT